LTWVSAFITNLIISHGNSKAESAVIALLFSFCGRKNKESADIGEVAGN